MLQPIDTLPLGNKSGDLVFVIDEDGIGLVEWCSRWSPKDPAHEWLCCNSGNYIRPEIGKQFTHWMPLPTLTNEEQS